MSTDLEHRLRRLGDEVTLSTPSAVVLRRGEQMRRRRRAAIGGGAAALVAVSAVGAAAILPSGPANPGLQPAVSAVAAFTGPETDLTPEQLDAVARTCGEEFNRVYSSEDAETGKSLRVGPLWELPAGDDARGRRDA